MLESHLDFTCNTFIHFIQLIMRLDWIPGTFTGLAGDASLQAWEKKPGGELCVGKSKTGTILCGSKMIQVSSKKPPKYRKKLNPHKSVGLVIPSRTCSTFFEETRPVWVETKPPPWVKMIAVPLAGV